MIKIYLFMVFLLIPKLLIASCSGGTFLGPATYEHMAIISFKVLEDSEITITKQFHGIPIKDDELILAPNELWGPTIPSPSKDNEWIAVLDPIFSSNNINDRNYQLRVCNKFLRIENNTIEFNYYDKIGIAALDGLEKPVTLTVSQFELILKAYFQGLESADEICKNGSYCMSVMPRYNRQTKELRVPVLSYFSDNKLFFIDATLQKSGEYPNIIFTVKDLKIESGH